MTLHLAPDLELPDEAAVQKFGVLAMSGAGKSNTAVVMAEEMHAAGIPWVAVDPKGDWWGVRSNASGEGPGIPVPVLGGLHGDVPLEPTAGKVIGNLVAERRLTCVLDVSEFESKAAQSRFLTDLAITLLKRNRHPLHLFLEEADEYLPQRFSSRGGDATAACVGAWQRVVKRGRFRGLGVTLISQRSAALNKDALNQIDTLIAMRVTAPTDRKAIRGWVEGQGLAAELVDSLPDLENGEGWLWSPAWLRTMQRTQFRRRTTFDSGATPLLIAEAAEHPATLADIDLDALKDEMAETIERAKADDPNELKRQLTEANRRIRELERDQPAPVVETVEVRVPHMPSADALLTIADRAMSLHDELTGLRESVMAEGAAITVPRPPVTRATPARVVKATPVPRMDAGPGEPLPKAERLMLGALAQMGALDKTRLGLLSGYTPGAGAFNNAIGALRTKGYVEPSRGFPTRINDAGLHALGSYEPLPTGRELADYWMGRSDVLGKAERAHLQVLLDVWPESMPRDEVAALAGYTAGTGASNNALGRLRSLQLIEGRGDLRATDALRG